MDYTTGAVLEYPQIKSGLDVKQWIEGFSNVAD